MSSLPVKPEFGPTLPDLLAPWWRRAPLALRVAPFLAVAVIVLLVALRLGGGSGERHVIVRDELTFNLRYNPAALDRVKPGAGELLALEARRGDLFLQSFRVARLEMPMHRGFPAAELPVLAEELKNVLAREFGDFQLVEEGRTRINEVPAYELVFSARSDEGRRLYGRWVMVVPEVRGARRGVTMELLGTPAAGIPGADQIGDQGQLKLPMRSLRFGAEGA